jgi:hypothetical protein
VQAELGVLELSPFEHQCWAALMPVFFSRTLVELCVGYARPAALAQPPVGGGGVQDSKTAASAATLSEGGKGAGSGAVTAPAGDGEEQQASDTAASPFLFLTRHGGLAAAVLHSCASAGLPCVCAGLPLRRLRSLVVEFVADTLTDKHISPHRLVQCIAINVAMGHTHARRPLTGSDTFSPAF